MLLLLLHFCKKVAFFCSQVHVKVTFTFLVSDFCRSQANKEKLLLLLHFIIKCMFLFPGRCKCSDRSGGDMLRCDHRIANPNFSVLLFSLPLPLPLPLLPSPSVSFPFSSWLGLAKMRVRGGGQASPTTQSSSGQWRR